MSKVYIVCDNVWWFILFVAVCIIEITANNSIACKHFDCENKKKNFRKQKLLLKVWQGQIIVKTNADQIDNVNERKTLSNVRIYKFKKKRSASWHNMWEANDIYF